MPSRFMSKWVPFSPASHTYVTQKHVTGHIISCLTKGCRSLSFTCKELHKIPVLGQGTVNGTLYRAHVLRCITPACRSLMAGWWKTKRRTMIKHTGSFQRHKHFRSISAIRADFTALCVPSHKTKSCVQDHSSHTTPGDCTSNVPIPFR